VQALQQRLVGLLRGREHRRLGLGIVEIGHRRGVLRHQLGVAADVPLGALELRLVARDVAFGLQDLRLDRAAVERDQEIALLHARAIGEMHPENFAVDARLDRDACHRRDGAERLDLHRCRLLHRLGDLDGDRARRGLLLRRLRGRAKRIPPARRGVALGDQIRGVSAGAIRHEVATGSQRENAANHQKSFAHQVLRPGIATRRLPLSNRPSGSPCRSGTLHEVYQLRCQNNCRPLPGSCARGSRAAGLSATRIFRHGGLGLNPDNPCVLPPGT
jgi:hypothetical protein